MTLHYYAEGAITVLCDMSNIGTLLWLLMGEQETFEIVPGIYVPYVDPAPYTHRWVLDAEAYEDQTVQPPVW